MNTNRLAGLCLAVGLAAASPWALSQQNQQNPQNVPAQDGAMGYGAGPGYGYGPGWGMGPGMMGGGYGYGPGMMGPGMMGGYGPGWGMGPGMMGGGYGYGPGMMGPGMMGYGYGPGMMGPGMGFGVGPIGALNLTQDQQQKINNIQDQLRKQALNVQNQIFDQQARLRDLYNQEQPDPKQVGEAYSRIATLQGQIAQAHAQAQNQMLNVLTPEQKQQLSQWRRGGPAFGGPAGGYRGMMPTR